MKFFTKIRVAASKPVKGGVILETLIGLLIIMVCFVVGITVYTNIVTSDKNALKLRAMGFLTRESIHAKENGSFIDSEEKYDNIIIKKKYTLYAGTKNLYRMHITVGDDKKNIVEWDELVIEPSATNKWSVEK